MLIEFDCGCIGFNEFQPSYDKGLVKVLVVDVCNDDADVGLGFKHIPRERPFKDLDPQKEEEIFIKLMLLINDGYKFRKMKELFDGKG